MIKTVSFQSMSPYVLVVRPVSQRTSDKRIHYNVEKKKSYKKKKQDHIEKQLSYW